MLGGEGMERSTKPGGTTFPCPSCGANAAAEGELCWGCANPDAMQEARALGGVRGGRKRRYQSLLDAQVSPVPITGLDDVLRQLGENLAVLRAMDSSPAVANAVTSCLRVATDVLLARLDAETVQQEIDKLKAAWGIE